jgi:hypothetical protein
MTSDKVHLLDSSWDYIRVYLTKANMRENFGTIRDKMDQITFNKSKHNDCFNMNNRVDIEN